MSSRHAPHGIPARPSGMTATILRIRDSPAVTMAAIAERSAHIPSEHVHDRLGG